MIHGVLIINNVGRVRLLRFYDSLPILHQNTVIRNIFSCISCRPQSSSCFLTNDIGYPSEYGNIRVVYRRYATLFIAFIVDDSENQLSTYDRITIFVESLNVIFENSLCELDLIFNADAANFILDEMIAGGIIVETNKKRITQRYLDCASMIKEEARQMTKKKV